ncbi:MAG: TolC family protein [Gammaproteobacteria bacterium]
MSQSFQYYLGCFIAVLFSVTAVSVMAADQSEVPLTLSEAEKLALANDPLLPRYDALAAAEQEQAVAEGQLPDPKLSIGAQDIPTHNFSATDDDFTMLTLGVQQAIPPGESLRYKQRKAQSLSSAEQARAEEQRRKLLSAVRSSWLEVYYHTQAVTVVQQSQQLLKQLTEVAQSQYGAGLATPQDLLSVELEQRMVKERLASIETDRAVAQAELTKWLGAHQLERPLAAEFPVLAEPAQRDGIEARLDNHPLMRVEDALVNAGQSEVEIARAQYQPGWEVGVNYGLRGGGRTDFLSAMVTVELPLFPDKRQDRRLAASQQQVHAAQYARDDRKRDLLHALATDYPVWQLLGERNTVYQNEILPQARQNTEAAIKAYQSSFGAFSEVIRARSTELEARLQGLRLQVDRAKAQARLLYLQGEAS